MNWNQMVQAIIRVMKNGALDRGLKARLGEMLLNSCGRARLNDGCNFNMLYMQLKETDEKNYPAILNIAENAAMYAQTRPKYPLTQCCRAGGAPRI